VLRILPGLVHELAVRCELLQSRLDAQARREEPLRSHAERGAAAVRELAGRVQALRDNPRLRLEGLEGSHLRNYRALLDQVILYERFLLTPLERFAAPDHLLTTLCATLASEIRWPLPPPLVSAYSTEYFWTLTGLNVVRAPAIEAAGALSLPDLCHELGHHLAWHFIDALAVGFSEALSAHLADAHRTVADKPWLQAQLLKLREIWTDRWLHEFVADIVATYLVGPPYGWQHVRLCAGQGLRLEDVDQLYGSTTHPADEARLRVVARSLRVLGYDEEGAELNDLWDKFTDASRWRRGPGYLVCYPEDVLLPLIESTIAGCRTMGLRPALDAAPGSIQAFVADAWAHFRGDPHGYHAWEAEAMKTLTDRLESPDRS
jgi:hypothetical protein